MEKLSLSEWLRYLLIGFILMGVAYICRPHDIVQLYDSLGQVWCTIFALIIGTYSYLLYRVTLYQYIILRFVDLVHSENVRNILMSRYKIPSRYKAEAFWKVIQENELSKISKSLDIGCAGTHLFYMTSVVAFLGSIFLLCDDFFSVRFCLLILIFLVFGFSAVVSDYYLETLFTFFLKSIENTKIDAIAKQLGFEKYESSDK